MPDGRRDSMKRYSIPPQRTVFEDTWGFGSRTGIWQFVCSVSMVKRKIIVSQCHQSVENSAFDKSKTTWSCRKKSFSEKYMAFYEFYACNADYKLKNAIIIHIYFFVIMNRLFQFPIMNFGRRTFWASAQCSWFGTTWPGDKSEKSQEHPNRFVTVRSNTL